MSEDLSISQSLAVVGGVIVTVLVVSRITKFIAAKITDKMIEKEKAEAQASK